MTPEQKLYGLLLCRAAGERLAFPAYQVVAVERWDASAGRPHARAAFAAPPQKGRTLVTDKGDAVAVDSVEVFQEYVALLGAPALLRQNMGGSLSGFAVVSRTPSASPGAPAKKELWPVFDVPAFSRYVSALPKQEGR